MKRKLADVRAVTRPGGRRQMGANIPPLDDERIPRAGLPVIGESRSSAIPTAPVATVTASIPIGPRRRSKTAKGSFT